MQIYAREKKKSNICCSQICPLSTHIHTLTHAHYIWCERARDRTKQQRYACCQPHNKFETHTHTKKHEKKHIFCITFVRCRICICLFALCVCECAAAILCVCMFFFLSATRSRQIPTTKQHRHYRHHSPPPQALPISAQTRQHVCAHTHKHTHKMWSGLTWPGHAVPLVSHRACVCV